MLLYTLIIFLTGCIAHDKVLTLFPSREITNQICTTHTNPPNLLFKVIPCESVKSKNIPSLEADGSLKVHKKVIWLREPYKLLEEYLQLHQNTLNNLRLTPTVITITLESCYFDSVTNKYTSQANLVLNNTQHKIKKTNTDCVTALRNLAHDCLQLINQHN